MQWIGPLTALVVAIGGVTGLRSLLSIRHDRRMGVRQADLADRDQVAAAQDRLIGRLQAALDSTEARARTSEAARRDEERYADALADHVRELGEYISVLHDHIRRRQPPPPPPQPAPFQRP